MFDEARWLSLDRHAGETLRAALERTLRDEILSGALRAGVRLPASRAFALQLGVSRGVVTDAYGQLEAQGFLVSRAREAPMVAEVQGPVAVRSEPEVSAPLPRHDLSPTSPDVTQFPLTRWLAAAQHVARRGGTAILDYREPRGESVLREMLADHLGRTRGVIADPAQIVIVQGTSQGVDLLLRLLRARGVSRVAVEDPSHTTQQQRIRAMGLEVVPQPVDTHGLVVDGLEVGAVVVTPAHQFPTGSVLSGARRRDLIAWSSANGAVIIEGSRVAAAGCFLPLSLNPLISKQLGTRHRAAIGVTEDSDAIAVLVSEETGSISLAFGGSIETNLIPEDLSDRLTDMFSRRRTTSVLPAALANVRTPVRR